MPYQQTALIVSVDTEEEGLWGGGYKAHGNTVENLKGIPRFQSLCEKYGVAPTYLIDMPVVEDDYGTQILEESLQRNACEVGAHLHPWCCPPFKEELGDRNSFMCNLEAELQGAKLQHLTTAITERFGQGPTSFRAGRYGMGIEAVRWLAQLNYEVDSSVLPFTSYLPHGPDFRQAPFMPYLVSEQDLLERVDGESTSNNVMLEVPIGVGFNRRDFRRSAKILEAIKGSSLSRLRLIGLLNRLGILRRIKFCPEQATAREMNCLAEIYLKLGAPCIVMLMHSSSFVPGHSPYCPTAEALERFYQHLEATLAHCTTTLQMPAMTLTEFARSYRAAAVDG